MQPTQAASGGRSPKPRAAGSFSPLPGPSSSSTSDARQSLELPKRPPALRIDSSGSEASSNLGGPSISITKTRQRTGSPVTPIAGQFATSHANSSRSSLHSNHQNFSRPGGRSATQGASSPLLKVSSSSFRKHSATQGHFEPTLPSTSTSNLSQVGMNHGGHGTSSAGTLSASQIAAQAAVMSHKNTQNALHTRQRSSTVPFPGESNEGPRRGSGSKGPVSPPMLSLTEASAPRDTGFGNTGGYHQDRLGSHSSAATTAANVVFPRSGHNSPNQPYAPPQPFPQLPPVPAIPEKLSTKVEKSKVKLFSRPGKIGTSKGEPKEKTIPSPGKIGSALSALQRGNFSTSSLVEPSAPSLYSLNNSSSATIRPTDGPFEDKGKEKEKKHHFLSRQKQKLKDEYHLPLSSAASNSRPTDPSAPSSLYNFNIPASPGPSSTSFAKTKKDKKNAERSESRLDNESTFGGPDGLMPPLSQQSTLYDPADPSRFGLQAVTSQEDAWPFLKSKLLVIFEGDDLRLPVEDFNRVVQMHIQRCIQKRSPNGLLDDLRDLLATGFSSLDRTLRKTPEDRFIPTLVELWLFTFTSILPYIQSVFLPLDLEVSGRGVLLTSDQARDFWGGIVTPSSSSDRPSRVTPIATVLDVRRLVLTAYRDAVILPRYDTLKTIFSRLSLEFLPSAFSNMALASPTPDASMSTSPPDYSPFMTRPGTAMSIDPSVGSYNSTSTTLLGEGSAGGRSRAVSNVSFGSHGSDGAHRPFTPSSMQVLSSVREQNVEDSKQVTDMVGRMLQCMSVLASLGAVGGSDDEGNGKVVELCKMLKLNWLGRGRTGRNRRGIVGGRVRRDEIREELRVA